jgi:vacuolar-type H+-ATPase subunit E/Vma4
MGYEELIKGLREEADEKVGQLWNDARAEAERIREDSSNRIERARREYRSNLENAAGDISNNILFDAEKKAREIVLKAEKKLSDLLFSLAKARLHLLRSKEYEKIFSVLAREIPSLKWQEVRVNPEDTAFAGELFPDARILPDDSITGGVEVCSEDGKICIINTFEKRLERAWEYILPFIMRDIYREA